MGKKRKPYTKNRKFKNDRLCSLDEVSKALGISIERVRVIEANALEKCNKWCVDNGYDLEELISVASRDSNTTYTISNDYNEEDYEQ